MKRKTYLGYINKLKDNEIFVFGSNPEGRHGKGTAKLAFNKFSAIYGQGHGIQGKSYGLVTKNLTINYYDKERNIIYNKIGKKSISEDQIITNIKFLYKYARKNKNLNFLIAYSSVGNNLNGYTSIEMAEMFYKAKPIPMNIIFEENFLKLIYKK